MVKVLNSVLLKPAGPECNMVCRYCFYLDKKNIFASRDNTRMQEGTLKKVIKGIYQSDAQSISIGWQGGEPTLMGVEFYLKAVELEKKYAGGKTITNGFQTNGILIDR